MRNFSRPSVGATHGPGAGGGHITPLAGANQARYKGVVSTPGVVKFSQWKRENEIPKRILFHDFLLGKIREKDPSKVWLKDESLGRVETFGRVAGSVGKMASAINKLGIVKDDVICMFCANYVEYWLLCLAGWSCGACIMPVNCEIDIEQLREQLAEARVTMLVCDDYNVDDAIELRDEMECLKHVVVMGSEGKGQGCIPISDLTSDDGKCPPKKPAMDPEYDVIYMPFTSSSSGEAKGIMHTTKSLISCFFSPDTAVNHYIDQMVGDSIALGTSFFHLSGMYPVLLAAIYGVTVHVLSDYSDKAFLSMIRDTKSATAALYPWQIRMLAQTSLPTKFDLTSLKSVMTTGGVVSSTIRMTLMDRFPNIKYVREAYGLNECGIVTLTYPREKKNSVLEIPDDHVMPVGLPNMYTQIKITDRQSGEAVGAAEEQGEICIKSPQCFAGYLHYPSNKQCFDSEGYFRTGDLGYYDSQGVIYFIERIEDLIHFWMYQVAPTIIETRLLGSNNIVDAAVVGIPNRENGEVPRAFVVLRPGFEETEENLTNMMESRLKDEERIRGGLYFVQTIPRDENGKILKPLLKSYQPMGTEGGIGYTAPEETPLTPGKSPKPPKKVIKELEKQPNGSFMGAHGKQGEDTTHGGASPRIKRASKKTQSGATKPPTGATGGGGGGVEALRKTTDGCRRVGGARRGSKDQDIHQMLVGSGGAVGGGFGGGGGAVSGVTFKYWMQVHVFPPTLEAIVNSHPAVEDSAVVGHNVSGIGHIPRAFIQLKSGYEATAEDIAHFVNQRLADTDRLRGGIVFVDKLPRDPSGKLILNTAKYDKNAEMVDKDFLRSQPKVKV